MPVKIEFTFRQGLCPACLDCSTDLLPEVGAGFRGVKSALNLGHTYSLLIVIGWNADNLKNFIEAASALLYDINPNSLDCYALTNFLFVICFVAFQSQWNPIAPSNQQNICSKIKMLSS